MKYRSIAEKLVLEEIRQIGQALRLTTRGLAIGPLMRSMRRQLGMSQRVLAKRAGVPQSTIARVELGQRDINLSTLNKISEAMSCELAILPVLYDSIDAIRKKQARKIAAKNIQYLKGTMNLEGQQPDVGFMQELITAEMERLLQGNGKKLWEEDD